MCCSKIFLHHLLNILQKKWLKSLSSFSLYLSDFILFGINFILRIVYLFVRLHKLLPEFPNVCSHIWRFWRFQRDKTQVDHVVCKYNRISWNLHPPSRQTDQTETWWRIMTYLLVTVSGQSAICISHASGNRTDWMWPP